MLTAASDVFDRVSVEYHELPGHLRTLAEAAFTLRGAWEILEQYETQSRREGRHDDAHDARNPEQSAYLAWQAAETAYNLIATRQKIADYEAGREAERKQRANAVAVADGMQPPYPDEY